MKRIFLIICLGGILFTSCKKEDKVDPNKEQEQTLVPVKQQWAFAINYTATWCGPCGNWGAPLIHEWEKMGNVITICAHVSSDPMHNSLQGSFASDRGTGTGIPSFWVGDKKTTSNNDVTQLLAKEPVASLAVNYSVKDNKMEVSTRALFYTAEEGTYYLSVLVLEDGIDGGAYDGNYSQSGAADDYKHDFVLRNSSVEGNAYGELLVENPTVDESIDKNYTIELDPSWKNVYAVALLWKYDATASPKYSFVNGVK